MPLTINNLNDFVEALFNIRNNASDELAAKNIIAYNEWENNINYKIDDRVRYNEALYKCLIAHTSQASWTPTDASSLWAKVLTGEAGEIKPWEQPNSTNPYMTGDKVLFNGKTWVSIIDNNVWSPSVYGWEEV